MALLGDFYTSLIDLKDEMASMGFSPWSLLITEESRNESVQDIEARKLKLFMLMMHLEGLQEIRTESLERTEEQLRLQLRVLFSGPLPEKWIEMARKTDPPFTVERIEEGAALWIPFNKKAPDHEVNVKKICDNFGLTQEESRYFLKETLKELQHRKLHILDLYKDKEWKELHRQVHSLKGTALSLGLDILRYKAQETEKNVRRHRVSVEELQGLLEETDRVIRDFPLE